MLGAGLETSAHEPLVDGGLTTGYWILIAVCTVGDPKACESGRAGDEEDLGRSTYETGRAVSRTMDSIEA